MQSCAVPKKDENVPLWESNSGGALSAQSKLFPSPSLCHPMTTHLGVQGAYIGTDGMEVRNTVLKMLK
ncbi:hypothetical protein FOZ62_029241, partial [Perkinsus olseni]